MNKLLTLIIPVYNTEKYLTRCFNSIIHPLVNVIIINDGSTDMSNFIIDKYCEMYSNFSSISTANKGAAAARVTGLAQVKTPYFGFVDSDDTINIDNYIKLVLELEQEKYKAINGRMSVYLPSLPIPFNSRAWDKKYIDFEKDKIEFNNITCSLLDKIWHIDVAPLFMEKTNQTVYEDMEFVYYCLAKQNRMLHSNLVIYNYRMRGLKNSSTSAIGLQMTKSNGIKGLFSAGDSMFQKFKRDGIYEQYHNELEAIMIKLIYQRIFYILNNNKIINKKEMAELVYKALESFISNWKDNPYFKSGFKGSEYNDYLFFIGTNLLSKFYKVETLNSSNENHQEILKQYDKKIRLKK